MTESVGKTKKILSILKLLELTWNTWCRELEQGEFKSEAFLTVNSQEVQDVLNNSDFFETIRYVLNLLKLLRSDKEFLETIAFEKVATTFEITIEEKELLNKLNTNFMENILDLPLQKVSYMICNIHQQLHTEGRPCKYDNLEANLYKVLTYIEKNYQGVKYYAEAKIINDSNKLFNPKMLDKKLERLSSKITLREILLELVNNTNREVFSLLFKEHLGSIYIKEDVDMLVFNNSVGNKKQKAQLKVDLQQLVSEKETSFLEVLPNGYLKCNMNALVEKFVLQKDMPLQLKYEYSLDAINCDSLERLLGFQKLLETTTVLGNYRILKPFDEDMYKCVNYLEVDTRDAFSKIGKYSNEKVVFNPYYNSSNTLFDTAREKVLQMSLSTKMDFKLDNIKTFNKDQFKKDLQSLLIIEYRRVIRGLMYKLNTLVNEMYKEKTFSNDYIDAMLCLLESLKIKGVSIQLTSPFVKDKKRAAFLTTYKEGDLQPYSYFDMEQQILNGKVQDMESLLKVVIDQTQGVYTLFKQYVRQFYYCYKTKGKELKNDTLAKLFSEIELILTYKL